MHKHAVKKLSFVIMYAPYWYKIKEVFDIVIVKNGGILGFIPNCFKNKNKWDKAADNCSYALMFFHDCYKTQKC